MTALSLANDHREILNDVSSLAAQELLAFLDSAISLEPEVRDQALRDGVPKIVQPYMGVASTVSAEYYNEVRGISESNNGLTYAPYAAEALETPESISKAYTLANVGITKLATVSLQEAVVFYGAIAQKTVFSASRENIDANGTNDDDFINGVRIARPGACAWCIRKTIETNAPLNGGFHDFCRCVAGAMFRGDKQRKYASDFTERFLNEYNTAVAETGDVEVEKIIRKNTDEYEKVIKRELVAPARDWRKDFEKRRGLDVDQRAAQRKSTTAQVNSLAFSS